MWVRRPKNSSVLKNLHLRRLKHAVNASGKATVAMHSVGKPKGLYLVVKPTGAKSWIFRKSISGTRRDIGLGGYPHVSLKRAQNKTNDVLTLIEKGIDPVSLKKQRSLSLVSHGRKRQYPQNMENFRTLSMLWIRPAFELYRLATRHQFGDHLPSLVMNFFLYLSPAFGMSSSSRMS